MQIHLHDGIGKNSDGEGISSKEFVEQLPKDGEEVEIRINSPGGNVYDGIAMANALFSYPGETTAVIEGICASAATFLAVSCKKIKMFESSILMVHGPWAETGGNADKLRDIADQLDKTKELMLAVYKRRGIPKATIDKWLESESTYLTAKEAKEVGLCDEIIKQPGQIKAELALHLFSPPRAKEMEKTMPGKAEARKKAEAAYKAAKAAGDEKEMDRCARLVAEAEGDEDTTTGEHKAKVRDDGPDIQAAVDKLLGPAKAELETQAAAIRAEREQFAKEREADKFVAEMKDKHGFDEAVIRDMHGTAGLDRARALLDNIAKSRPNPLYARQSHGTTSATPTVPNIRNYGGVLMAGGAMSQEAKALAAADTRQISHAQKMLDAYHKLKGENVFAGGAR